MPNINDSITWAVDTCNDPNVGYSQVYREQQTVSGITYYDCSSFIWYALLAGGFDCASAYGSSHPFVTDYMPTVLTTLGFQTINMSEEWKPGDICLRTGHTEMVYEGGIGQGRTMGAHSSHYPLDRQVSINSYWSNSSDWEEIYRYGSGGDTQVQFGVDVSEHNGDINWAVAKDEVDFVIIRAGYGSNHTDAKFTRNADACTQYNIPFGVYWFSYALSVQDAVDEANYCCSLLSNYNLSYPVFYDWEDDSDRYYTQQMGRNAEKWQRESFARAFMNTVIGNGYDAGLYTNPNYIQNMGMGFILTENQFQLWLADWTPQTPSYECQIWQYGSGQVNGFPTEVDLNKTSGYTPRPPEPSKEFKWWMYLKRTIY